MEVILRKYLHFFSSLSVVCTLEVKCILNVILDTTSLFGSLKKTSFGQKRELAYKLRRSTAEILLKTFTATAFYEEKHVEVNREEAETGNPRINSTIVNCILKYFCFIFLC